MIYFIKEYGLARSNVSHIKIGYTKDDKSLLLRLNSLQTGNPNKLIILFTAPGEPKTERLIHQFFASDRACGEWFYPSVTLTLFIEKCLRSVCDIDLAELLEGHSGSDGLHDVYQKVRASKSPQTYKGLNSTQIRQQYFGSCTNLRFNRIRKNRDFPNPALIEGMEIWAEKDIDEWFTSVFP